MYERIGRPWSSTTINTVHKLVKAYKGYGDSRRRCRGFGTLAQTRSKLRGCAYIPKKKVHSGEDRTIHNIPTAAQYNNRRNFIFGPHFRCTIMASSILDPALAYVPCSGASHVKFRLLPKHLCIAGHERRNRH